MVKILKILIVLVLFISFVPKVYAERQRVTKFIAEIKDEGIYKKVYFVYDCEKTSSPSNQTLPVSGLSSVPKICSKVLLPAPEAPTILTTSPFLISTSTPFSTSNSPYFFFNPSAFNIASYLLN